MFALFTDLSVPTLSMQRLLADFSRCASNSPWNSWNDLGHLRTSSNMLKTGSKFKEIHLIDDPLCCLNEFTTFYDTSLISRVCAAQCKTHSTLSGRLTVLSALKIVLPTFANCFWQNPSSSLTEAKAGSKMSLGVDKLQS